MELFREEHTAGSEGNRPPRRLPRLLGAVLAAGALCLAGCQGSSGDASGAKSPSGGRGGSAGKAPDPLLGYARCMRSHGITDFPDPTRSDGHYSLKTNGIDSGTAQYHDAQQACQSKLAGGAGNATPPQPDQVAAFAKCVRSHGYPDFADPTVSGGGMHYNLPPGVKLGSAQFQQFQKALQTCRPKMTKGSGS